MEDSNPMKGESQIPNPEDLTFDGRRRCTAKSKQSQERCKRAATPGTNVCANHGSKAPQVKRKAALRLLELTDPAIAVLAREMIQGDRSADRLKAANSILDRAGIVRGTSVTVDDAKEALITRLKAIRDNDEDMEDEDD